MKFYDDKKLAKIKAMLIRKEQTLAVAESVTAGLLQLAIAQAENAAEFYQGGITAYNLGQKYRHLKVDPIHAEATNCVSAKVAAQMAVEVCNQFGATWGMGITGYATPVPESANKLFAFYAIAKDGKVIRKGRLSHHKNDDPFEVQQFYTSSMLDKLLEVIK